MRYSIPLLCLFVLFSACRQSPEKQIPYQKVVGKTMGTYYEITFQDSIKRDHQEAIDKLLVEFNQSLSTYIPESLISRINREKGKLEVDAYFGRVFKDAKEIYKSSKGSFDPTIMPLVNFWGFGFEEIPERSETKLAELKASMGFDELSLIQDQENYKVYLLKPRAETQIDFSAIAKGTGVDILAEYLERNGIENYLVNIGGEVRANGKNDREQWWNLGVNVPKENADVQEYQEVVALKNMSMATSGNYRNSKIIDGKKAVHTINPRTGRPEISNLLSATILSKECATADAFATACMVLGLEEAQKLIEADYRLEGLLLFGDQAGEIQSWQSKGLETRASGLMQ